MSAARGERGGGCRSKKKGGKKGIITKTCFQLLCSSLTFENPSSISFCTASSYACITDARAAARLRPSSANASGSSAESSPLDGDGAPIEGAAVEDALLLLLPKAAAFVAPTRRWPVSRVVRASPPGDERFAGRERPATRRPREGTTAAEAAARRTRAQGLVAAGIVSKAGLGITLISRVLGDSQSPL